MRARVAKPKADVKIFLHQALVARIAGQPSQACAILRVFHRSYESLLAKIYVRGWLINRTRRNLERIS